MTVGKKNRIWLRAVIISSALVGAASSTDTHAREPIQRLGRNFGFGWGDGYHACADSGLRVGADLPPRSFADAHGARLHHQHPFTAMGHQHGSTFYDRFDSDGANCCDSACDAMAKDLPARTLIQDSQVFRGHSLPPTPSSDIASNQTRPQSAPVPNSPVPNSVPISPFPSRPVPDSALTGPVPNSPNSVSNSVSKSTDATAPSFSLPVPDLRFGAESNNDSGLAATDRKDSFTEKARILLPEKQYPIRPQPPVVANSNIYPLVSDRTPSILPQPADDPGPANTARILESVASPLPSITPMSIQPIHPSDGHPSPLASSLGRPSHTGIQAAINNSDASPAFAPKIEPKQAEVPTQPSLSNSKPATRLMGESLAAESLKSVPPQSPTSPKPAQLVSPTADSLVSTPPKTRLVYPKSASVPNPRSTTSVGSVPSRIVANPLISEPAKSEAIVKDFKETPKQRELVEPADAYSLSAAKEPPAARPHRLGSSTGTLVSVKAGSVDEQKSTAGVDPGVVRANPFALRPTVQLAKRPSDSSEGVIYQPSSTSASQQR